MNEKLNENKLMTIVDNIYMQALSGLPRMESAEELAKEYLKEPGDVYEQADSLIRWQITKCATSGFLTGLGGLITLPVAILVNLASTIYVQLRMIAAIAYIGGYNPKDDKVKTFVYVCLCGNQAKEILKDSMAIPVGTVAAKAAINAIPREVIKK